MIPPLRKISTIAPLALVLASAGAQDELIFTDSFESEVADPEPQLCETTLENFNRVVDVLYVRNNETRRGSTYAEIFNPWDISSSSLRIKLNANQYASLPFTVSADGEGDDIANLIWEYTESTPQQVRISVARCIGAPMEETTIPQPDGYSCFAQDSGSSGAFTMRAREALYPTGCLLKENIQYFLNIAFADADGGRACFHLGGCAWNVMEQ